MKIKIRKEYLSVILCSVIVFAVSVELRYLTFLYPPISTLQNYGCVAVTMILLGFLMLRSRNGFSKRLRIIYIYVLIVMTILVSTLVHDGSITGCLAKLLPMLAVALLLELYRWNENKLFVALNTLICLLLILIIVDLITEIAFPSGLYTSDNYTNNWFLGYKTNRYVIAFPLIIISGYVNLRKKGRIGISGCLVVALCFIDCYLSGATGCSVSIIIFLALYIIMSLISKRDTQRSQRVVYRLMNYKFFLVLYALLNLLVVGIWSFSGLGVVLGMLDKDITFSGRTTIWRNLLDVLRDNIILGRGYISSEQFVRYSGLSAGTNAHNAAFQLLMFGGVVALALYLFMLVLSVNRNRKRYNQQEIFLMAGLYSLLILGLTSAIMVISQFGLLCFWLMEYEKNNTVMKGDNEVCQQGK